MPWTWDEVIADPQLQELPYKLELNADGELIMNAVRVIHSFLVYEIQQHLQKLRSIGSTPTEFPVRTKDGVRSPDIVWISQERKALTLNESAASLAPEICIEVMSPGNTERKMLEKKDLYIDAGALECWICDENGIMRFYNLTGSLEQSRLVPEFPKQITT